MSYRKLNMNDLSRRECVDAEVVVVCVPSSVGGLEDIIIREGLSVVKLPQQRIFSLNDAKVSVQLHVTVICTTII